MKNNKLIKDILGWGLIIIVILIIVSVIAIFAGAIMQFFGFRYNSVCDIILLFYENPQIVWGFSKALAMS